MGLNGINFFISALLGQAVPQCVTSQSFYDH